ncbi:hypothetical protein TNCV_13251 [Trichonephila clavipes]|nr:hypothetical protein TNCV_13251 [Trichonephila clavipes]
MRSRPVSFAKESLIPFSVMYGNSSEHLAECIKNGNLCGDIKKKSWPILRLVLILKLRENRVYLKRDEYILSEFSKLLYPAIASI